MPKTITIEVTTGPNDWDYYVCNVRMVEVYERSLWVSAVAFSGEDYSARFEIPQELVRNMYPEDLQDCFTDKILYDRLCMATHLADKWTYDREQAKPIEHEG